MPKNIKSLPVVRKGASAKPAPVAKAIARVILTIGRDGTVSYEIESTHPAVLASYAKRMTGETEAKGVARGIQLAAGVGREPGQSRADYAEANA
jgi:malate/lactate dehydrogenase